MDNKCQFHYFKKCRKRNLLCRRKEILPLIGKGKNFAYLQDGPSDTHFPYCTGISYKGSFNSSTSFNKSLFYLIAKPQWEECKVCGINTLKCVCMNMICSPQWKGRIWRRPIYFWCRWYKCYQWYSIFRSHCLY